MVMQSASGKRGRARSPQKMRAVEFKNKKPTVSNLLTVGLVLRYKKTPLPRRASSFKQKKRVRTRIASRLSLGSVDKKDTRHKRERKAVIKQKPRTRLARRGSRLVPMFITTLSQTRMKSRFLAADEYISPKKSNSVGASWLKPSRKIAHLRLSSPPYIMEAQRRQAR